MKTPRLKAQPRTPRRWRTPPPLTRGPENLEGMDILRELGGDAGILLWQSYRNVMFWATAEGEQRASVFSPNASERRLEELRDADVPTELVEPLTVIGQMLGDAEKTEGETVAEACTEIASWAEARGASSTQLAFTQAAALAAPRSAELAHRVGVISRQRGDMARAETWYRHAIMIGRQVGDWTSYSLAYIALGNMLVQRGNFPAAHRMHIKALRASRRKGLRKIQALALHDLFGIAVETGREAQAEEFARLAVRAYGSEHPRLPALANDVAYWWMQQGHFDRVLPIFQALLPRFEGQAEEIYVHAHVARAAGGAGNRDMFRKEWVEVTRMARDPLYAAKLSGAMVELAEGAASLGEWDRAEQAAERGLSLAQERSEYKLVARSEAILDAARSGRRFERSEIRGTVTSGKADAIAADLVRSLATAGSM